ncbi:MAG: peptidase M48 [Opitutus sp.]|nr:peptidase M48 [Opitutus sp.]
MRFKANMPRLSRLMTRGALCVSAWLVSLSNHVSAATGFDPVAATEAYLAKMSPEARARSDAYFEGNYWLILINLIVSLLLSWLLLKTGFAAGLRARAERWASRTFVQTWLFVVLFSIVSWALNLPLDYYEGFWREHFYQMSTQTAGAWFGDKVKGLVISLLMVPLLVALLYAGIRRFQQRWWIVASMVTPFLLLFFIVLAPVFLAPVFNKYVPLADPKVRDPILSMARANGVPADNVYEFDASRRTKRVSANVSGAFNTIRVSLNDNLLTRCPPEGVMAVMGHELGHYVLNHVHRHVVYLSLLFALGFWFTNWFFHFALARWGAAWGVRGIGDIAGLPLVGMGLGIFLFLATPIRNTIIRVAEVEADYYGLNSARQPDAMADAFLLLGEYRKMHPGKWEEIVFFDHPSGYNRILACMRWKAEHLDELAAAKK